MSHDQYTLRQPGRIVARSDLLIICGADFRVRYFELERRLRSSTVQLGRLYTVEKMYLTNIATDLKFVLQLIQMRPI